MIENSDKSKQTATATIPQAGTRSVTIPNNWETRRLKRVCRFEYGDSLTDEFRTNSGIPVYGSNGLIGHTSNPNAHGECLVIGRKGSSGKVLYSEDSAYAIDTTFFIDHRQTDANIKWLYYLLTSLELESLSADVGVPGLNRERAYQQTCAYPPSEEQAAIVRFLDHADEQIQRYIAGKERLIALLEEQRQALVHQAVTRGLDPSVKFKDSGVEWLGDVPEHWTVQRLKTVCTMKSGEGITAMSIESEGKYPVYGGNGLRGYTSDFTHDGEHVLVGRQGALCGNVHIAEGRFWASEHAVVATPYPKYMIGWLGPVLEAMNLNQYSISAAQPGLAVERILNLWTVVPPHEEQYTLSEYIGEQTAEIAGAISQTHRQIALMTEYQTRLIADVVTGQLDVREAAAQLQESS